MAKYGSLMTLLADRDPTPHAFNVGDGVTVCHWTDRTACTIVAAVHFKNGKLKHLIAREDNATRTDANGMSECQSYAYKPNPPGVGREYIVKLTTKGWKAGANKEPVIPGRRKYHDFSF